MRPQGFDVHEELGAAPLSAFHVRLAVLLGALIVFDGYDTVNPSYAVHYLVPQWHLSASEGGLLVSSGLFGFFFGAAAHGRLADRYGRRGVLLWALLLAAICTVLTPVIGKSLISFCSIRFATGIGLGVLMPLATTYINEFAPRRYANMMPVWGVALGWSLGATAASVAGIYLTPRFGWSVLYYVGAAAIPLLAIAFFALPESVRFLALRGQEEEVRKWLVAMRPERAELYQHAPMIQLGTSLARGRMSALLAEPYRRTTLVLWLAALLSLFGVYALSGWIPTVMIQRGEHFAAGFAFGAVMQMASFFGAAAGAYLIDREGSATRWLACLWFLGALSVAMLAVWNSHTINLLGVTFAGFGVPGAQFLLNNFTARSYETSIRATGVGAELAVGRLGAILGPYVAGLLQESYHTSSAMFVAVAGTSLLAGVAILALRPANSARAAFEPTSLAQHIEETFE